jgi:hypothetical protein
MTSAGKKLNNWVRWSWTFLAMGILLTSLGRSGTAGDAQAQGAVRTIADDSVRGHDLIELAVRRIGGAEKLRGIVALHYSLEGDSFNGRKPVSGRDPEQGSYRSFASFNDPDGNGWLLQEITTRLPGRIDPVATTFSSVSDLASAVRRAAAAYGEHEAQIGKADPNSPDWYAEYMVREQAGEELPL